MLLRFRRRERRGAKRRQTETQPLLLWVVIFADSIEQDMAGEYPPVACP